MTKVRIQIPSSTSNLGPGFDVLGLALSLYNIVEIQTSNSSLKIEIEGEGKGKLPTDESNLVYRAFATFFSRIGRCVPPVMIRMYNSIPLARGLGSSGTAIIAGLVGANVISEVQMSMGQILHIASEIDGHPDNVAASIFGGFVIASPVSDSIAYIKIIPPKPKKVLVVVPDIYLHTDHARSVLPMSVELSKAVFNIGRASLLVAALATGEFGLISVSMEDKIHQPYRIGLIPGADDAFKAAKSVDINAGVAISGAGSSLLAISNDEDSYIEMGKKMQDAFYKHGIDSKFLILDVDTKGTQVLCCNE